MRDEARIALESKVEELRKKAAAIILHAMLRRSLKAKLDVLVRAAIKRREEEEHRRREEEERRRREEEERRKREEEERRRREEEERRKREEEERRRREEEARRKKEEEERKRLDAEAAERERKREEEKERRRKELDELKRAEEEAERDRKRIREEKERGEQERKRKEEEQTRRKQEQQQLAEAEEEAALEAEMARSREAKQRKRAEAEEEEAAEAARLRGGAGAVKPKEKQRSVTSVPKNPEDTTAKGGGGQPPTKEKEVEEVFAKAEQLSKLGAAIVTSHKANSGLVDTELLVDGDGLLSVFRAKSKVVSDTRTYARVAAKVEEQARALLDKATDSEGSLAELEAAAEQLVKAVIVWRQTALALGRSTMGRGTAREGRAGSGATGAAPASWENVFLVVRNGKGEESRVGAAESAARVKEGLGATANQRLRGFGSAPLKVDNNCTSLASVPWIAMCLRVGVCPVLELCDDKDDANDAAELRKMMDEEERVYAVLGGGSCLGPYAPQWTKANTIAGDQAPIRSLVMRGVFGDTPRTRVSVVDHCVQSLPAPPPRLPATPAVKMQIKVVGVRNVSKPASLQVRFFDGPRLLMEPAVTKVCPCNEKEVRFDLAIGLLALGEIPPGAYLQFSLHGDDEVSLLSPHVSPFIHMCIIYLFIFKSSKIFIYLSIHLSIYLSISIIYLSIYIYTYGCIYLSSIYHLSSYLSNLSI